MKTTPILERCIVCPKCRTSTMRKAHGNVLGKEYFDDKCHEYFGITELVNQWNYDLGDFWYSVKSNHAEQENIMDLVQKKIDQINKPLEIPKEKIVATTWFDGESVTICDEPVFKSLKDREESYEVVNWMLSEQGIKNKLEMELGWGSGLEGCSNEGIDTGHYR